METTPKGKAMFNTAHQQDKNGTGVFKAAMPKQDSGSYTPHQHAWGQSALGEQSPVKQQLKNRRTQMSATQAH